MPNLLILTAALMALQPPVEPAKIGDKAPEFTIAGADGKTYSPSQFEGKYLVLEWTNKDCPFVRKHYGSGNMQETQAEAKKLGAVWLSICSSASGKEGYLDASGQLAHMKEVKSNAVTVLLDSDGKVGKLFGAKTTPQIAIIDPKGKLIYNGAIDDQPTPDPASVPIAHNYALAALKEAMAGKPVTVATSRPYGCGVKYAD